MEMWDIYDENKKRTGRTMKKNDWCLKEGEYHLTVLGIVAHTDGRFLITKRVMTKAWAPAGGRSQAGLVRQERLQKKRCSGKSKRRQGLMCPAGTAGICLATSGRIPARETIILWISIVLLLILTRRIFIYRRRRLTAGCSLRPRRSKHLRHRGFFFTMTVSSARSNCHLQNREMNECRE